MQSYWIYQYRDNLQWEGIIEAHLEFASEGWVAGSLHLVEADSLAEALVTVMPVGKVIRRMFDDVLEFGNEFAYHKWFDEDFEEDGGMNKEAAESLRLASRFLVHE